MLAADACVMVHMLQLMVVCGQEMRNTLVMLHVNLHSLCRRRLLQQRRLVR
jgi:hypothetical protein